MTAQIFAGLPEPKKDLVVNRVKETHPDTIMNAVCVTLNIRHEDLTGRIKTRELAEARCIAIGLILRANPAMTLKSVGKIFSRHHSTVIYSRALYSDLMEIDPEFKRKVSLIKRLV